MSFVDVTYDAPRHEILVLENMWRERALACRCVTLSLAFWRVLPADVIRIIASHMACNLRATDVLAWDKRRGYRIQLSPRR